MIANSMSTISKFWIVTCFYLVLPMHIGGTAQGVGTMPSAESDLVGVATEQFSDLRLLCATHGDVCTKVAAVANSIGAGASEGLAFIHRWSADKA